MITPPEFHDIMKIDLIDRATRKVSVDDDTAIDLLNEAIEELERIRQRAVTIRVENQDAGKRVQFYSGALCWRMVKVGWRLAIYGCAYIRRVTLG